MSLKLKVEYKHNLFASLQPLHRNISSMPRLKARSCVLTNSASRSREEPDEILILGRSYNTVRASIHLAIHIPGGAIASECQGYIGLANTTVKIQCIQSHKLAQSCQNTSTLRPYFLHHPISHCAIITVMITGRY
jgi:hypothetical protein